MSSSRSMPEAARGCWYFIPKDSTVNGGLPRPRQMIALRVDGSFSQYQIKDDRRKPPVNGDYTYDGNFLILRSRTTETFRVRRESFWRWSLEGKRKNYDLIRGLFTESDFIELNEKQSRDIRILPLRVRVEADFQHEDDQIYRLVYHPEEGNPLLLGTFFSEDDRNAGRRWIGLTPLATNLAPATWERIIHDSFLDLYCSKPDYISVVTVRLLDTNESRVFSYGVTR